LTRTFGGDSNAPMFSGWLKPAPRARGRAPVAKKTPTVRRKAAAAKVGATTAG
jgi:hypothetical protein